MAAEDDMMDVGREETVQTDQPGTSGVAGTSTVSANMTGRPVRYQQPRAIKDKKLQHELDKDDDRRSDAASEFRMKWQGFKNIINFSTHLDGPATQHLEEAIQWVTSKNDKIVTIKVEYEGVDGRIVETKCKSFRTNAVGECVSQFGGCPPLPTLRTLTLWRPVWSDGSGPMSPAKVIYIANTVNQLLRLAVTVRRQPNDVIYEIEAERVAQTNRVKPAKVMGKELMLRAQPVDEFSRKDVLIVSDSELNSHGMNGLLSRNAVQLTFGGMGTQNMIYVTKAQREEYFPAVTKIVMCVGIVDILKSGLASTIQGHQEAVKLAQKVADDIDLFGESIKPVTLFWILPFRGVKAT